VRRWLVLRYANKYDFYICSLLVILVSLPGLYWFGRNWRLAQDPAWYMLQGLNLAGGRGYTTYGDLPSPLRGPVMAVIIALIIELLGADATRVIWAVRVLSIFTPISIYLCVREIRGKVVALLAVFLFAFWGLLTVMYIAFSPDAIMMAFYFFSLYLFIKSIKRRHLLLALFSGLLMALAVLTKETSIVALPIPVFASVLMSNCGSLSLAFYVGTALLLIPWWGWVYFKTHEIYLINLGQINISSPAYLILGAVLIAIVVGAITLFLVMSRARFTQIPTRIRILISWSCSCVWIVLVTYLLMKGLHGYKEQPVVQHIRMAIIPYLKLWYLYPLAAAYGIWLVYRYRNALSQLFLISSFIWVPIVIVTLWKGYAARQLIVPQAYIFAFLGMMIVDLANDTFSFSLRKREVAVNISRFIALLPLGIILLGAAAFHLRWMLTFADVHRREGSIYIHQAAVNTASWLSRNVPRGQTVFITLDGTSEIPDHLPAILAFEDKLNHNWKAPYYVSDIAPSNYTRALCAQGSCSSVIWIGREDGCTYRIFSLDYLRNLMQKDRSSYLVVFKVRSNPATGLWADTLTRSGMFDVVYNSNPNAYKTKRDFQGFVVFRLRNNAYLSSNLPAAIDSVSLSDLKTCTANRIGSIEGLLRKQVSIIEPPYSVLSNPAR